MIFSVICLGYKLEPWKRITGSKAGLYEALPTDPRQNFAVRFHEDFDSRAMQPEVAAEYRCKSESFGAVSAASNGCPWWLSIHDTTVEAVKVRHSSYRQCDDHAGSTRLNLLTGLPTVAGGYV